MINLDLLLREADTIAIAGHMNPDGDCVGSCLATYNYIKEYYPDKRVDLYLDPIPNIFKFLRYSEDIKSERSENICYDLMIVQDCGDVDRLGESVKYYDSAKVTVNIDHHISNDLFCKYHYVIPTASSTSELIFNLMPKEKINRFIAECLYVGMVHDTGVFQYSCTSKSTMEAAGFLMELGINYSKIVDETYFVKTFEQQKIIGLALLKSKLHLDGLCISCFITQEEMNQYHVLPKHLDGISSMLRSTKGVETSVFLYENGENQYKVSMRSAQYMDVAAIAVKHGGGGHIRAAGCTLKGKPEELIDMLVNEIEEQRKGGEC